MQMSFFQICFHWLDEVKTLIAQHSDTLFVIRAHPDEIRPGKESLETVTDWVVRNRVNLLTNVLYVGPDQYFSSYELIQNAKFVLVYNSTIGLEAAIMRSGNFRRSFPLYTGTDNVFSTIG
jgi:hypothetical protein